MRVAAKLLRAFAPLIAQYTKWAVLVAVQFMAGQAWAAAAFPDIPSPPGARVASLGDQMRIHGTRARIRGVSMQGSANDLFAFYREAFGGGVLPETPAGSQYRAISGLIGNSLVTVMITSEKGGQTQAQLLQTLPKDEDGSAASPPPATPPNTQILSDVESIDNQMLSRILVMSNRYSIVENIAYFKMLAAKDGLTEVQSSSSDNKGGPITTIWFASASNESRVTVQDLGQHRLITFNRVRALPVNGSP